MIDDHKREALLYVEEHYAKDYDWFALHSHIRLLNVDSYHCRLCLKRTIVVGCLRPWTGRTRPCTTSGSF